MLRPAAATQLLILAVGLLAAVAPTRAQSDLDALMERVLSRRDENWKKLQQYILNETETFQLTTAGGTKLFGSKREYLWYPNDTGRFVKSPTTIDGVTLSESERRRAEQRWLETEQRRQKRMEVRAKRDGSSSVDVKDAPETDATTLTEEGVRDALEPGFISAAYFLRFKFEPGHYALAGRETLEGRNVLRIEYYPAQLFREGRTRPNKEVRERDKDIEVKMNKSSLVTLWVDAAERQILKYDFDNIDMDFLPGRSFVRVGGLDAVMEMSQPFPAIWLPRTIRVAVDVTLASGEMNARYNVAFHDYREAVTSGRVR